LNLTVAAPLADGTEELPRQCGNGESFRVKFLLDGPLFQGVHKVGDFEVTGTANGTRVARSAQPDSKTAQDLVFESCPGHGHNPPGRIVHIDAHRTGGTAGATLDAAKECFTTRDV